MISYIYLLLWFVILYLNNRGKNKKTVEQEVKEIMKRDAKI